MSELRTALEGRDFRRRIPRYLPVANDHELASAGLRSNVIGAAHGSVGARRWAWKIRYRYLPVLGSREAVGREPAVELREGGQVTSLPRSEAIARIVQAVAEHHITTEDAFAEVVPVDKSPSW